MSVQPSVAAVRWIGRERRIHRRVALSAPATLFTDTATCPAQCLNLSMGGARLRTDSALPSGTVLKLAVELGPGRRVQALAEVVRAASGDMGVRFIQLDPASMLAILTQVR